MGTDTYSITPLQSGVLGSFLDNVMESAIHLQKVKLCEAYNTMERILRGKPGQMNRLIKKAI